MQTMSTKELGQLADNPAFRVTCIWTKRDLEAKGPWSVTRYFDEHPGRLQPRILMIQEYVRRDIPVKVTLLELSSNKTITYEICK